MDRSIIASLFFLGFHAEAQLKPTPTSTPKGLEGQGGTPLLKITSFQINKGAASTTKEMVTLNNTVQGEAVEYRASMRPNLQDAQWHPYSPSPTFKLEGGFGTKTIYFQVRNPKGVSSVVSDSIRWEAPSETAPPQKIPEGRPGFIGPKEKVTPAPKEIPSKGETPSIPVKGAVKKIPAEDRRDLTPLSLPLPDVANILQFKLSTVSPFFWEVPFDNYSLESFRLDWNQFAFSDFKQITLSIFYLGQRGEVRVDERTFRKDGPNTYSVGLRAIFDWLKKHGASAEAWKIYRFKITGTVTLTQSQSKTSSGGLSLPSGQAQSMRQTTTTSSQEKVIPTNSFLVDLFLKSREEERVSPSTSGQIGEGIKFAALPPSSEGRFKIILDSYQGDLNCRWYLDYNSLPQFCYGCLILNVLVKDLKLTIENVKDHREKCVTTDVRGFGKNQDGHTIRIASGISGHGQRREDPNPLGVESEQSITNLLKKPGCTHINPQGKTFRIWGEGRMIVVYEKYKAIGSKCQIENKTKEFLVYSPSALYVTLYPEEVAQDLQQQTRTELMLPQEKPAPLKLDHPSGMISLPGSAIVNLLGAKIDFSQPLRVNWLDSARTFPPGMETWIEIRKVISNELISSPQIREGSSAEIRPPSGETTIAGGFPPGTYKVNHAFCYPFGSTLNPSSTIPLCTAYSDPVYFQSDVPISKVDLRFGDFQLTPRNSHHGLSVRLYNLSSQTLTRDYVSGIWVHFESPSGGNTSFTIPTPIPGRAGEASQPAPFDLPSNCDILSHLDRQTITLRIDETELWGPTSITQTFTVPQRERSNLSFEGGLAFLRSNDGKQVTVNFRVKEELRGRPNIYIPYKIKFRVSKAGGHIIHEEEFERQPSLEGPWSMSFILNKEDILRKSGGERHLAAEVILDWDGRYAESNENDNVLFSWYDF